jgi:hypothetical protein
MERYAMRMIGTLLLSVAAVAGCTAPAQGTAAVNPAANPVVATGATVATAPVVATSAATATAPVVATSAAVATAPATATAPAVRTKPVRLEGGLTLHPPADWSVQPPQATKVVLVPASNDSLVIASIDAGQISLVVAELSNGFTLGTGVFLRPTGAPRVANGIHSNDFVAEGSPTEARGVVMARSADSGRVLTLIGLAEPGQIEMIRTTMAAMIASATISAAAAAPSGGELAAYLKGRYLVRFYSGNGYSEKHELWLCTNGQFRSRFDGGGFTQGVASGAFEGGNVGTWTAQGNRAGGVLSLSASDGAQSRFEVRESSDALLLNGQKWLRGENSLCD